MVRKKKAAAEDEKSTEEVTVTAEAPKVTEEPEVVETITEPIEEPKAAFMDETTKLINLLTDAPAVPLIINIEQAVEFVDRYRVWKNRVKAEIG